MYVKPYRKHLVWRIGLFGGNGELIMSSEAYYSKGNAVREANRVRSEMKDQTIEDTAV